jgi:hypothetical protein
MYRFEDDRRRDGKVTVKLDCCGDHVRLGGTDGEISLSNALRWLLINRPKAAQSPVNRVVGKQDQHFSDQLQQRVGNHLSLFGVATACVQGSSSPIRRPRLRDRVCQYPLRQFE